MTPELPRVANSAWGVQGSMTRSVGRLGDLERSGPIMPDGERDARPGSIPAFEQLEVLVGIFDRAIPIEGRIGPIRYQGTISFFLDPLAPSNDEPV